MARIDTLENFLTDVATSIKNKTGKTNSITPANFDTEINSIESSGGGSNSKYAPKYISFYKSQEYYLDEEVSNLDTSNIQYMTYMFANCEFLNSLDLTNFNTSNVVTMAYMFYGSLKLNSIDISTFDLTSLNVTENMFYGCTYLRTLNLGEFNASLTRVASMFYGCANLTSLDLHNITGEEVETCASMFNGCSKLKSVDLRNFNAGNRASSKLKITTMFNGCSSLEYLDIRSMNFENIGSSTSFLNGVPANCEIIVKDDTAKSWIKKHRSDLTNVKTVAEYEAE